ncbi:MAG: hypothetical protein WC223_06270 [Bacteroidales bacterium]|jgi:hypothetical protein
MLLNRTYYQAVWDKYQNIETLDLKLNDNFFVLTLKIIIEHYKNKKPVHFNFQCSDNTLRKIGQHLFIELANDIYLNYADLPPSFEVGQRLKRNRDNKYYRVLGIDNNRYTLIEEQRKRFKYTESTKTILPDLTYDSIAKSFVEVDTGISERTINNYINFFKELNNQKTDFLQTHFERKSVFIAPKTFYDLLEVKNKIPTTYFPNPREESNSHETKSIPALPDSIMYFVPKYKVCYDKIIQQQTKVDTIVVYNTEETEIEHIIQDKNRFGFNLIMLTNTSNLNKYNQVPCWNWYKEEIDLINML